MGKFTTFQHRISVLLVVGSTLLMIGWGSSLHAQAQLTPEAEVRVAIETLFSGMFDGDSAKVHAVMGDNVQMQTTTQRAGKPVLFDGSLERFLGAVGSPHEEVWNERISGLDIKVDDNLAVAWMNYSFYRGEVFSHCGVNTMTLFRSEAGWKIIYLADSRRQSDCN